MISTVVHKYNFLCQFPPTLTSKVFLIKYESYLISLPQLFGLFVVKPVYPNSNSHLGYRGYHFSKFIPTCDGDVLSVVDDVSIDNDTPVMTSSISKSVSLIFWRCAHSGSECVSLRRCGLGHVSTSSLLQKGFERPQRKDLLNLMLICDECPRQHSHFLGASW